MNPSYLHVLASQAKVHELRRAALAHQEASSAAAQEASSPRNRPITLRLGFPDDREAIRHLAELDSALSPAEPLLLAEVAGELRAALSLADGVVIADPFHPSTELLELLRARARQLQDGPRSKRRLRLRLPLRTTGAHIPS